MRSATLTVLQVAYPFAPVSRDSVGGAEQIVSILDQHLTRAGHSSLVVASDRSNVAGTLIPTHIPGGELTPSRRADLQQHHRATVEHALTVHRPDVVHIHAIDPLAYLAPTPTAALITLHLPLAWYSPEVFSSAATLNCVSRSQRDDTSLSVIPNGVEEPPTPAHRRLFCLALGRICPEKGYHSALAAAHLAQVPLLLAGQVFPYPEHIAYFESTVRPLLDSHRRFIGPANLRAKRALLARATCLLIPSLVAETSSLVAMEALMQGVPVIAFRSGALPEIVEDGVTGYLVNDEQEMADAILRVSQIDSTTCSRIARQRFSAEAMVNGYIETYRRIIHAN